MALPGAKIEYRPVCGGCSYDGRSFNEALSQEVTKPAQFGLGGFKNPC